MRLRLPLPLRGVCLVVSACVLLCTALYRMQVDVFSFGVLLYEVFGRTLLLAAMLNTDTLRNKGITTAEVRRGAPTSPQPGAREGAVAQAACSIKASLAVHTRHL